CECQPACIQLLQRGLFGCSPYRPGVAVDVKQLDFLSILHTNIAPNLSAWCVSLQEHLNSFGSCSTQRWRLDRINHIILVL
ncbi:hypothetical protein BS47DRAFT_1287607, partial [Hydnum rufescens UP504]